MNQETQENVDPPPPRPIGRTQQLFETASKAGNDQIFKGDVIIKKLKKKHQYRITFSKVYGDRFFFYQVFNKDNTDSVNDQRFAAYITTKNLINEYDTYNNTSKFFNKLVFTPTTIMELPNFSKYAFVIRNVYFNSHKRLVFMVSTKEINIQNNNLKKLTQIPCGKFKHVRFDVDPIEDINDGIIAKPINEVWDLITNVCKTKPINDTVYVRQIYTSIYRPRACDIPMPDYPHVCDGVRIQDLLKDNSSQCRYKLTDMVNNNLLPEVFTYMMTAFTNNGCIINTCDEKYKAPEPILYFNPDKITDGVININVPPDNVSIDLSKYVIGTNGKKQLYEIEVLDGITINGSTLLISTKKEISLNLTVRQKFILNREIKATLNIIPS